VFETGIRQFRMAMAMMWGWHIKPRIIEHMVADTLKTLQEFGAAGDDVQQLLDGPFTDPVARKEYQVRMVQHTARRLLRRSPYYSKLFAAHDIDPNTLTLETLSRIPATRKEDLIEQPHAFVCNDAQVALTTRTTGTTGQPAEIWLSKYEIDLWPALAALSGLLRGELLPNDRWQINISSRATAAIQIDTTVARLAGVRISLLGIIPPEESLDLLTTGDDRAPTLLSTYPSYLARLLNEANRRGLTASDFCLRRIDCGGEVLTQALKRAATETFGPALVNDTYGMTEILPMGARICNQGHLHHDLNVGFVEVIDLDSGQPAAPGEPGTLVITPYYPYRECMPVFRYDTRDIVRSVPDESLTCDLAGISATTNILGKASNLLRVNGQWVTTRDLSEVYEALPSHPWPARFHARAVEDHIEMVVSEEALDQGVTRAQIERRYQERGLDVRVVDCVTREQDVIQLRPLRADLLETTFARRT